MQAPVQASVQASVQAPVLQARLPASNLEFLIISRVPEAFWRVISAMEAYDEHCTRVLIGCFLLHGAGL